MPQRRLAVCTLVLAVASVGSMTAHHSHPYFYDECKSVTIEASRARDGSASGLIRQLTLNDGTVVQACPQYC